MLLSIIISVPKVLFLKSHFHKYNFWILSNKIILLLIIAPRMFFGACEHQHGTPDRTSGVLIMRNFSKRVDRVTHRKLPSGPVPKQGRRSYSCNLGLEPENVRNCNRSCAEVIQNRIQMSVRPSVRSRLLAKSPFKNTPHETKKTPE